MMTLDLGTVSDLRTASNTPPPPYSASPWSQTVSVFFYFMMIRMVLLRMIAVDNLLLLSLLFLLYHICHHSFLKSCYLKKCSFFCVLSLFSFFNAFKNGQKFDIYCHSPKQSSHILEVRAQSDLRPLGGDMQKCRDLNQTD